MTERAASLHARERAWERYGHSLREADARACVALIKAGRAEFVRDAYVRPQEIWRVTLGEWLVPVVFNPLTETIVTVLPVDAYQLAGPPPKLRRARTWFGDLLAAAWGIA